MAALTHGVRDFSATCHLLDCHHRPDHSNVPEPGGGEKGEEEEVEEREEVDYKLTRQYLPATHPRNQPTHVLAHLGSK